MRDNPIAMIEFVAFIGFVIWLFVWQHKSSKPDATRTEQARTDVESATTRVEPPTES
jgi:hypothetical protein